MLEQALQTLEIHFLAFLVGAAALFAGLDIVFRGSMQFGTIVRQWALNASLYALGLLLSVQLPISMLVSAETSYRLGTGVRGLFHHGFVADLAIWIVCYTLVQYLIHRAMHRFSFLWAIHRVHHLDEIVDSSTALRHHPLESLIALLVFSGLAFVLAPRASVVVLWSAIELLVDLWTHSRLPLSVEVARKMERVFFTPRLHRIHHSSNPTQTDSNYGNAVLVWDKLFGTLCTEAPQRLGLDDPTASGAASRDFDKLLADPLTFLRRRWRAKSAD